MVNNTIYKGHNNGENSMLTFKDASTGRTVIILFDLSYSIHWEVEFPRRGVWFGKNLGDIGKFPIVVDFLPKLDATQAAREYEKLLELYTTKRGSNV